MRTLIYISVHLSMCVCYAQFANNDQIITMSDGVTVSVHGLDVVNSGNWNNDGQLLLNQNWTNTQVYQSNDGHFILNGQDQLVDQGISNFNRLSVLGGGIKTMLSDWLVETQLILDSGLVDAGDFQIYLENGSSLTGGSSIAYIIGKLSQSNDGTLTYPIGTASNYLPTVLLEVQSNENLIGMSVNGGETTTSIGSRIKNISPNRYWELTSTGEFNANGFTLPVLNEIFIEKTENITAAYSDGINPYEPLENTILDGSLEEGSLSHTGIVQAGLYAISELSPEDPPITVINVVTGNNDGKHDFLRIDNITFYESNKVEIFNRTGQKIFQMSDYNNTDRVFEGRANIGGNELLPTGSYFFSIRLGKKKTESGFIYVKN